MNQSNQYDDEYQKYLEKIGMAPTIQVNKYQRLNTQSNSTVEEMSLRINRLQKMEPIFQTINSITILNNQCKFDFRAQKYSAFLQNYKENDEKFQQKSQSQLSSKNKNRTTTDSHFTTLIMNEDVTSNNSQFSNNQQENLKLDLCSPHSTLDFTSNNILQLPKFNLDSIQPFEKNYSSSSIIQEGINSNNHFQNYKELCGKNEPINQKNIVSTHENMNLNNQLTLVIQNYQIENLQSCNNVIVEHPHQEVNSEKDPLQIFTSILNDRIVEKKEIPFQPQKQQDFILIKKKIKIEKQKEKQRKSRKINKQKKREQKKIKAKNLQNMIKSIPNEMLNLDQKRFEESELNSVEETKKEQKIENPVCKLLEKIISEFSRIPTISIKKSQNLLLKQIMIRTKILKRTQEIDRKKY